MPRGKNINLYLMYGEVNGRVKCTLANMKVFDCININI